MTRSVAARRTHLLIKKLFPALVTLAFAFTNNNLWAQENFADVALGAYSKDDLKLTKVDFEPDASAVIIYHSARSNYNDHYNLITEHRVKLKILTEKGLDEANIVIPFYSKDGFEYLSGIEAVIINEKGGGQIAVENLDKKAVFTKKIDDHYSETRFTLPNVKVGSIIEYTYVSNMKSYGGLEDWYFQSKLPTITSYYKLEVLPTAEFTYKVYKLPQFAIDIDTKTPGFVSYKMNNIPALHDEAFMDSRKDNLQRVAFQLSAINNNGYKAKYITKWEEAAPELLSNSSFGGQLHKSLSGTDDFIKTTKTLGSDMAKLRAVYDYVQHKMSSNGYNSKYSVDGIKRAWDKGTGTTGEINMALINLLTEVEMTAYPLLVNNRYYGKVDISYPFIDQFSKIVAYVSVDGKMLVIDASDLTTPPGMMPMDLLNTYAYIVDKKQKGLVQLKDSKLYDENRININSSLNNEGVLSGNAIIQSVDYAKLERKERYQKDEQEKFIKRYFREDQTDLKVTDLDLANLDTSLKPLNQTFTFQQTLNTSGDYTFLSYHLFTGLGSNPFTAATRFSDINFGSPQRYMVNQLINLPDNYEIDALPKNMAMITPDTAFMLKRYIKQEDKQISVQFVLDINQSYFERDDYVMVQSFFKKMYTILNEQIVLKKKA